MDEFRADAVGPRVDGWAGGSDPVIAEHAPGVYDYCLSLVGDAAAAGEATRETLSRAEEAGRAGQLPASHWVRLWLFAVARDEALGRWAADPGQPGRDNTVEIDIGSVAHRGDGPAALAAARLSAEDRELLDLSLRHGLNEQEIAEILGINWHDAPARLEEARARLEEAYQSVAWQGSPRERNPFAEYAALPLASLPPWLGLALGTPDAEYPADDGTHDPTYAAPDRPEGAVPVVGPPYEPGGQDATSYLSAGGTPPFGGAQPFGGDPAWTPPPGPGDPFGSDPAHVPAPAWTPPPDQYDRFGPDPAHLPAADWIPPPGQDEMYGPDPVQATPDPTWRPPLGPVGPLPAAAFGTGPAQPAQPPPPVSRPAESATRVRQSEVGEPDSRRTGTLIAAAAATLVLLLGVGFVLFRVLGGDDRNVVLPALTESADVAPGPDGSQSPSVLSSGLASASASPAPSPNAPGPTDDPRPTVSRPPAPPPPPAGTGMAPYVYAAARTATSGCTATWEASVVVTVSRNTARRVSVRYWWSGGPIREQGTSSLGGGRFATTIGGLPHNVEVNFRAVAVTVDGRTGQSPVLTLTRRSC